LHIVDLRSSSQSKKESSVKFVEKEAFCGFSISVDVCRNQLVVFVTNDPMPPDALEEDSRFLAKVVSTLCAAR
jgi:hypothetical protein